METKGIFYISAWVFFFAGTLVASFNYYTMKRAGLWYSVKTFGIDTNWGAFKSHISFWKNRDRIDLKTKKTIYFQWILWTLFLALALIALFLGVFWPR